uniref:Glucokinase n=1 Tax=Aureoumbra lagunensis TaxID=44058 RepID=A0A7S3NMV2_9STRA|mmetsp:Transcript_12600/g.16956  ORF Transcript_12600/g.16956 Transcript_12600/m.16956 type:complete len:532 (-) Transcript_12600:97-1692(-)
MSKKEEDETTFSFSGGEEESDESVNEGFLSLGRKPSDAAMIEKLQPPPPLSPKYRQTLMKHVDVVVVGDLGGTNSRLALYRIEDPSAVSEHSLKEVGSVSSLYRNTYKNIDYSDFTQVLHQFLIDSQLPHIELVAGCLAVAGPVENDRVNFTNKNLWSIDGRRLEEEFVMPRESMRLVNDFVANGFGAVTLGPGDYEDISPFGHINPTKGAPVVCVGAGTGLGETYATSAPGCKPCDDKDKIDKDTDKPVRYEAWPSEGGHVAFAPRDEIQREMLAFLSDKFQGRVSTERVVSGKGIVNIYEFLASKFPEKVNPRYDNDIRSASEGAAIVAQASYDDELCAKVMDIFMNAYGSEVGNAAVKWIPKGGLYITGGIAGHNSDKIRPPESPFMTAYKDRGRLQPLLNDIPLRLVKIDDLGLRGAHYVALTILIERVEATAVTAVDSKQETNGISHQESSSTIPKLELPPVLFGTSTTDARANKEPRVTRSSMTSLIGLQKPLQDLTKAILFGSSLMAASITLSACLVILKSRSK